MLSDIIWLERSQSVDARGTCQIQTNLLCEKAVYWGQIGAIGHCYAYEHKGEVRQKRTTHENFTFKHCHNRKEVAQGRGIIRNLTHAEHERNRRPGVAIGNKSRDDELSHLNFFSHLEVEK